MNKEMIFSALRHILTLGSGYLAGKCVSCTADELTSISAGVMALAAIGWSYWEKRAKK